MGAARKEAFRVDFDTRLRLEFHRAKVSTDAGLFPYSALGDVAQLTESGAADLFDFRTDRDICHSISAPLRQSIFSRLAGYEDTNDAGRWSIDTVMRHVVGGRAADRTAASASQVSRFEADMLTQPGNLGARNAGTAEMGRPVRKSCIVCTVRGGSGLIPAVALGAGRCTPVQWPIEAWQMGNPDQLPSGRGPAPR